MKLDIATMVFFTSIVYVTQTIAVFVQYRVNRSYLGLGWWLIGAIFQALGFSLMLALVYPSIWVFSIFANPLIFMGQIFLNTGIIKFLDRKENVSVPVIFFIGFIICYFVFIFLDNSITGRSIVVSVSAAMITGKMAYALFRWKKKYFSGSGNFTASVFFIYACLQTVITFANIFLPTIVSYDNFSQIPIRALAFILPVVGSMLWTFGFIIMVNQRLNAENFEDKEKLRMVFNISPDAKLITRLSDGILVDINDGFLAMTGYDREGTIGHSIGDVHIWKNSQDRISFMDELKEKGFAINIEYSFLRKNGSKFTGLISGKTIVMNDQIHSVSVIRDVTEYKNAEKEIQDLLHEKEIILKEVHHRIKNNMNTISGLISLQTASLKDPLSIAALQDTGNRIQSMMILYEKLYKSTNFMELRIGEYLSPLIDEIISNFPNANLVKAEKHFDDFILSVKMLQPIGIMVNELLTNSMKYAFEGKNSGTIKVSASLVEDHITIIVEDDGNGLPESVKMETSTGFGLMLVYQLAKQLMGTIGIERGQGTKIVLKFEK